MEELRRVVMENWEVEYQEEPKLRTIFGKFRLEIFWCKDPSQKILQLNPRLHVWSARLTPWWRISNLWFQENLSLKIEGNQYWNFFVEFLEYQDSNAKNKIDFYLTEWFARNRKPPNVTFVEQVLQLVKEGINFWKSSFFPKLKALFRLNGLSGFWRKPQNHKFFNQLLLYRWKVFVWDLYQKVQNFFGEMWVAISRKFNANCAFW